MRHYAEQQSVSRKPPGFYKCWSTYKLDPPRVIWLESSDSFPNDEAHFHRHHQSSWPPHLSLCVSLTNSCALQNSAKKCMHLISSFSSCGLLNTFKGCDCGQNCKRQGGGALKQRRRCSSNVSVLPQHHWVELRVNYSMPFVPRVLFLLIPTRDFQFLFSPPFPIIFTEVGGRGQREKTV